MTWYGIGMTISAVFTIVFVILAWICIVLWLRGDDKVINVDFRCKHCGKGIVQLRCEEYCKFNGVTIAYRPTMVSRVYFSN